MPLSLIIPAYNSAATIRRCLDSIYALPLEETEFEVIVVDDASTDGTGRIVEEYVEAHANLIMIRHLVNRVLGAARNTGLAVAKGDCIAFVDSDDEVVPGMACAMKMMEESELDMIAMRVEILPEEGESADQRTLPYSPGEVFKGTQLMTEHPFWMTQVWANLYRRSFLEEVNYPFVEGLFMEDTDFVNTHLYRAGRVAYCDQCGYRYHETTGSITRTRGYRQLAGDILMGGRLLDLYERMEDKTSPWAQSVLEVGSCSLTKCFRQLVRQPSVTEVRSVYNMIDSRVDRKTFLKYIEPTTFWNFWTRFCLKHRVMATGIARVVSAGLKLRRKLK